MQLHKLFVGLYISMLFSTVTFANSNNDTIQTKDSTHLHLNSSIRTHAHSKVYSNEFSDGIYYPMKAIQGKSSGLSVAKKGGDPGTSPDVILRGLSSIFNGNQPLYIIDGVVGASPEFLSTDDIASYIILKDIASTALYGHRGANGVILVETKRPAKDKILNIDVNTFISLNSNSNRLNLFSADEMRDLAQEIFEEDNYPSQYTVDSIFKDGGANTNWQDEIMENSISQVTSIALHGAHDNTSYRGSITSKQQDGTIIETGDKQFNSRFYLSQDLFNDKLNLEGNVSYFSKETDCINTDNFGQHNILLHTYQANPTDPIVNDKGSYDLPTRVYNYNNPIAIAKYIENKHKSSGFISRFQIKYEIINGIEVGASISNNITNYETSYYIPDFNNGFSSKEYMETTKDEFVRDNVRPFLYASRKIRKHAVGISMGYIHEKHSYKDCERDMSENERNELEYEINDNKVKSPYASFSYNFGERYFINYNYRRDELSSKGASLEQKFTSISLGWNAKKEFFLKDMEFLSALEFKMSYGTSGNSRHVYDEYYYGFSDIEIIKTFDEFYLEHVKSRNFGFELGILENRLLFSMDFYKEIAEDLLVPKPKVYFENPSFDEYIDFLEQTNKGIEWTLSANLINTAKFKWSTRTSYHQNKYETKVTNEHLDYLECRHNFIQGRAILGNDNYVNIFADGYNYGDFYLPQHEGIIKGQGVTYLNQHGWRTSELALAERHVQGNAFPSYEFGWSNHFTLFDKFFLDIHSRAVMGHSIYNATRMFMSSINTSLNTTHDAYDEFREYKNTRPKISSIFLEDASFFRLDNITLGYKLKMKKQNWFQSLEVYCGGNNLLTITDYKGVDPEVSYTFESVGVDNYNIYPPIKSFFLGCRVRI